MEAETTAPAQSSFITMVQALEGIEQKKSFLRDFSKKYGAIAKQQGTNINGVLVMLYAREGAANLKTFKHWKEDGYKVKKGSKSLILWSGQINRNSSKENSNEDKDGGNYFKIAFVFSENSVEKI